MGWLSRFFDKGAPVAYSIWHSGKDAVSCERASAIDGTCWVPGSGFDETPAGQGCPWPKRCTCKVLVVREDEAWGKGNAAWIQKQGGVVSAERMEKFYRS